MLNESDEAEKLGNKTKKEINSERATFNMEFDLLVLINN